MSLRIKKDLRNLRAEWALAAILTTIPALLMRGLDWPIEEIVPIHLLMLAIGASWLGAGVIGKDISLGILAFTFAQGKSRRQLWSEKVRTAGIQVGTLLLGSVVCLILVASTLEGSASLPTPPLLQTPIQILLALTIALTGIAGGTFFSLALRSYQGAFWLTLLSPFALSVLLIFPIILSPLPAVPDAYWIFIWLTIVVYAITLGILATKRFRSWQDLGTWGGDIWFSLGIQETPKQVNKRRVRRYRPLWGLARKELCLQQLNIMVTLLLIGLYLFSVSTYNIATQTPGEAALLAGFARVLVLIFLPLAFGATTISEERRLKVAQWQQVLPSSTRFQWTIKIGMAYLITAVFTIAAPFAVDFAFQEFWSRMALNSKVASWIVVVIPFLAVTLGIYASSLSQSFLVALGSSAVIALAIVGIYFLGLKAVLTTIVPDGLAQPQLLFGIVLLLIGLPILWWLAYDNYRRIRSLRPLILNNGITWSVAILASILATQFVYARAWERLTHRPPQPGDPIVAPDVEPKIIQGTWATVLAPDGTLWTSQHHVHWYEEETRPSETMIKLDEDSDWVRAFSTLRNIYAIKRDGRLFTAKKWGRDSFDLSPVSDPDPGAGWTRVMGGPGTMPVIGLKNNGTLWQWQEEDDGSLTHPTPYLQDTRWKAVARDSRFFVGIRADDNTLWAWGLKHGFTPAILTNPIIEKIGKETAALFPHSGAPNPEDPDTKALIDQARPLLSKLGVDIMDAGDQTAASRYMGERYKEENAFDTLFPLGTETNWESVQFGGRIAGHGYGNDGHLSDNVLIVSKTDGSHWVPTACARIHWKIENPNDNDAPFIEIPSNLIPRQFKYDFDPHQEVLTQLAEDGMLGVSEIKNNQRFPTVDFTLPTSPLSDRTDWLGFAQDHYSIVALSADGLLWHAGPYPIDSVPSNTLTLVFPASKKLRPVFDFRTGKAFK